MRSRYGARLIFETRDEHGLIEVVQDDFERTLHFGSVAKQSAMERSNPIRLALSYTRAMLAPLIFLPGEPVRVLLVGLGGGSLAKFLLHYYPDLRLDVVELRPAVTEVAKNYFALPESPRLTLSIADATEFVRLLPDRGLYDLILLDAFDQRGIAPGICTLAFFTACRSLLNDAGLLSVNLWSRDRVALEEVLEDIRSSFGAVPLRLPVDGKDNLIAIGGAPPLKRRDARAISEKAKGLDERTGVEFPLLLRALRKHNSVSF